MFFRTCAALLGAMTLTFLQVAQASAEIKIPLEDIIVSGYAGDKVVAQTRTDGSGQFVFKDLAPGTYTIKIDGPSLMTAINKSSQPIRSPPSAAQVPPRPNAGRPAPGNPVVADVNGGGKTDVVVSIGLLLPAVQAAREAARRAAPQSFRQPATGRGLDIKLTVPASAGPASSWKGTIGREP